MIQTRQAVVAISARLLAVLHGHAHLDWVMLLDPVATDVLPFWKVLAHLVEAPHHGRASISIDHVKQGDALSVQHLQQRSRTLSAPTVVVQPSGPVDTAGVAAIRTLVGVHWNMACLQAVCFSAAMASAASGWLAVHRPLKCFDALGLWRGGRVRLIAHDSKSCRGNTLVGSNPTLSVLMTSW